MSEINKSLTKLGRKITLSQLHGTPSIDLPRSSSVRAVLWQCTSVTSLLIDSTATTQSFIRIVSASHFVVVA